MIGQAISRYRIIEKLGEGGMGVVYKAEDTKLRRTVALKFLPRDAIENRERFLREAQAAAALNHPNVCTVFEVDEEQGFLAMEFLDGITVKDKIAQRPLPLDEALDIGMQACAGLQAAHERGIVHRDIKPANLMVTAEGQVKIMDFGLAQVSDRTRITKTGASLGTPAYMSPEQVKSEAVDRRTDLWSMGVLLYEMLTGRLPFGGESEAALTYAIANAEPEPLTALRTGLPRDLDRIVSKALAKKPEERYQNASDVLVDLRRLKVDPVRPSPRRLRMAVTASVVGAAIVIAWYLAGQRTDEHENAPARKFEMALGDSVSYPVISPDGAKVAYENEGKLWVREFRQLRPREIPDTSGAARPFWSPDSEWIGYAVDHSLWKSPVRGGSRVLIGHFKSNLFGATWSAGGTIVFATYQLGLFEVPSAGGQAKLFLKPDDSLGEFDFHEPHWLPDGKTLLCVTHGRETTQYRVIAVRDGKRSIVAVSSDERLAAPVYSREGHVLFSFDRNAMSVWAVAFEAAGLRTIGPQLQVTADGTWPSVAADGTLAFWTGASPPTHLVVVDRSGKALKTTSVAYRELRHPRVSPDGRRVIAPSHEGGNWDIWEYDLEQDRRKRLTFSTAADLEAVWSPDGKRLVSRTDFRLAILPEAGAGNPEPLTAADGGPADPHWGTGDVVVYGRRAPDDSSFDIWHLRPGKALPSALLTSPADERQPAVSPDGRYLAYVSNESRRMEVYVRPFPSGESSRIVSTNGGTRPRWSPRNDELFFLERGSMMSAKIDVNGGFRSSPPEKLFDGAVQRFRLNDGYDVMPDGKRFVVVQGAAKGTSGVVVVQNWLSEFRK